MAVSQKHLSVSEIASGNKEILSVSQSEAHDSESETAVSKEIKAAGQSEAHSSQYNRICRQRN